MSPEMNIGVFAQVNFWMLGWLSAAAAPVLIHLWSRQRYRQTWWAAMEYLLAAVRRSRRRTRIEQWLLLAVRTLLILLVVTAVFASLFEHTALAPVSVARTHRVLVLDASYSMAYKPKQQSRFDRARLLARQIIEDSRQGDAFTVVLMSSPPQVVVGKPALQPDAVLGEIDELRVLHTAFDLPATVGKVREVVHGAADEDPGLGRHEVYFLTDMGRKGWSPELSAAAAADFLDRTKELAEVARLVVIDLGQPEAENLAVVDLRSRDPVATLGRNVELEVSLKGFGRPLRTRQPVELLVDGRSVGQKSCDVVPDEQSTVAFSYRFETPGDHTVEVRAAGDALEVDNHRWMAVPVRQSIGVLCINGRLSGQPFHGATDFLLYALCPEAGRTEKPLVRAEVKSERAIRELDLGGYDCVFLCDVAQFTSDEARVLQTYLAGGGNLVFFLGPSVMPQRYNRELGGREPGVRLLPAELLSVQTLTQDGLDPLGYRHPIVEAFRGRQRAGLLTAPVLKYFKLRLAKGSRAEVALATTGGDPMIVADSVGRGRVVLVATSAGASWTDMPMYPSYVPLVQELLAWCAGGELKRRNVKVGQPLSISMATDQTGVPLLVQGPRGPSREMRLNNQGGYLTLDYTETITAGIYTAGFGPPISRTQGFAVNLDTDPGRADLLESNLEKLSEGQLRKEVWPDVPLQYFTQWEGLQEPPAVPIAQPSRLPVRMLYVVLSLLFVETLLAWRFGHHTI